MKKIKTNFICRRVPTDTLRVETLDQGALGQELYLRMEEREKFKASVILNPEQARELARRITETFGAAPAGHKLWEDLS